MSICSLGIMGTKYVRDGEPLQKTVEIIQGESLTIPVAHIYSYHPIGNTLSISLRQAEDP